MVVGGSGESTVVHSSRQYRAHEGLRGPREHATFKDLKAVCGGVQHSDWWQNGTA